MARLAKLALALGEREFAWILKHSRRQNEPVADLLEKRLAGEPLQYILGTTPFGPLDLLTRPPTLIPRPETEDWTLRLARTRSPSSANPVRVLDLGTGTGCIPLLLCHLWPPDSARALGLDISRQALRLAAENAARSRIRNVFTPLLGDMLDPALPLPPLAPFDVITANPPYISLHDYHALPSSVKDYEDPRALIGGEDGLHFYRAIAALLARDGLCAPHATIALEVGHDQAQDVVHILRRALGLRLGPVEIWKDPWDKDRVVFARVASHLGFTSTTASVP